MTTEPIQLPSFHTRQDGRGYVIYLPERATYLFADDAAHEALAGLRSQSLEEASESITARLGTTREESDALAHALAEVLTGRRSSVGDAQSGQELLLCPLSDIVGERCDTFGMPL